MATSAEQELLDAIMRLRKMATERAKGSIFRRLANRNNYFWDFMTGLLIERYESDGEREKRIANSERVKQLYHSRKKKGFCTKCGDAVAQVHRNGKPHIYCEDCKSRDHK